MTKQKPSKHYEGKPCKKCGNALRYQSSDRCVTCNQSRGNLQYQLTPDLIKARSRQWRQANPDLVKGYKKRWVEANPEMDRQHKRQWVEANPGKVKHTRQRYQYKRRSAVSIPYTTTQLKAKFEIFGNECVYCLSREDLTVDHFLPLSLGGIDGLINLVPACRSCNCSKNDSDPIAWMKERGLSDAYVKSLVELILDLSEEAT